MLHASGRTHQGASTTPRTHGCSHPTRSSRVRGVGQGRAGSCRAGVCDSCGAHVCVCVCVCVCVHIPHQLDPKLVCDGDGRVAIVPADDLRPELALRTTNTQHVCDSHISALCCHSSFIYSEIAWRLENAEAGCVYAHTTRRCRSRRHGRRHDPGPRRPSLRSRTAGGGSPPPSRPPRPR